jgi:hypothetical protein
MKYSEDAVRTGRTRRSGAATECGDARWIEQASQQLHCNMLATALANELARIAVLARGQAYQPRITINAV